MSTIIIVHEHDSRIVEFTDKMLLSDALRQAEMHFDMPCGGKRTCAKCRVKAKGELSPLYELESKNLTEDEINSGIRLACCAFAIGDVTIYYNTNHKKMQVVESGFMSEFDRKPIVKSVLLQLKNPTLENPTDDEGNIAEACDLDIPLKLMKKLPLFIRNNKFKPNVIHCNNTVIDIQAQNGKYYGVAVDIGTTTVAVYLYELSDCELIATASGHNAQAVFGADVISRIEYVSNEGGSDELLNAIKNQINSLIIELANESDITVENIYATVITGNTTMLHLLCGIEPKYIAVSPFAPATLFGRWFGASELGIIINPCGMAYLPRCITAYIGGDITAGIMASGMNKLTGYNLLIDIGTNGEMALGTPDGIVCCSTAAGPAFEGAGLYMGMAGVEGAVGKVWLEDGKIKYEVIGDVKPIGICGSGIIDAVAVMLKTEVLDPTGIINEDGHDFEEYIKEYDGQPAFEIGTSGVMITQKDIRQIQLAKSAIAAGIQTLIHECGIGCETVDMLFIAGGFGSYINQASAADIGLFPIELLDKVKVLGNAAGAGASMMLLSEDVLADSIEVAKGARTVELSSNPYFMDKYIDCMMFE